VEKVTEIVCAEILTFHTSAKNHIWEWFAGSHLPAEWELLGRGVQVCGVSIVAYVGGGKAGETDHRVNKWAV
jgi:hypothetical protein